MSDEDWIDDPDEPSELEEALTCPECGAEVYADAESCPACGYWIAEADRTAAWNSDSATGRIKSIGLLLIGLAALTWLIVSLY